MIDRYAALVAHADTGLGLDEYNGPARFTRPTDRDRNGLSASDQEPAEATNPNPHKKGQDQ